MTKYTMEWGVLKGLIQDIGSFLHIFLKKFVEISCVFLDIYYN